MVSEALSEGEHATKVTSNNVREVKDFNVIALCVTFWSGFFTAILSGNALTGKAYIPNRKVAPGNTPVHASAPLAQVKMATHTYKTAQAKVPLWYFNLVTVMLGFVPEQENGL